MAKAVEVYGLALRDQPFRAAEQLASIRLRNLPEANEDARLTLPLGKTPREWAYIAVEGGDTTAACRAASYDFGFISRLRKWSTLESLTFEVQTQTNDLSEKELAAAVNALKKCAFGKSRKHEAAPPFGSPALYAVKYQGSRPALVNSDSYGQIYLATLYASGFMIERDFGRAKELLVPLAEDDWDIAREILVIIEKAERP